MELTKRAVFPPKGEVVGRRRAKSNCRNLEERKVHTDHYDQARKSPEGEPFRAFSVVDRLADNQFELDAVPVKEDMGLEIVDDSTRDHSGKVAGIALQVLRNRRENIANREVLIHGSERDTESPELDSKS